MLVPCAGRFFLPIAAGYEPAVSFRQARWPNSLRQVLQTHPRFSHLLSPPRTFFSCSNEQFFDFAFLANASENAWNRYWALGLCGKNMLLEAVSISTLPARFGFIFVSPNHSQFFTEWQMRTPRPHLFSSGAFLDVPPGLRLCRNTMPLDVSSW